MARRFRIAISSVTLPPPDVNTTPLINVLLVLLVLLIMLLPIASHGTRVQLLIARGAVSDVPIELGIEWGGVVVWDGAPYDIVARALAAARRLGVE
jgi:biopolymer transport protein ExbD